MCECYDNGKEHYCGDKNFDSRKLGGVETIMIQSYELGGNL